jgi:uncharacterized protein YjbJ (UPF0337 family)
MGFWDKLLGRGKQTAGETTDDTSMQREGAQQEQKAMAEERAESAGAAAQEAREQTGEQEIRRESES